MIIYVFEFFLIIWGKLSELKPEPEFLTSWSRSWNRTKMDRLRNTGILYSAFENKRNLKGTFFQYYFH
jgi:hypothetical protein